MANNALGWYPHPTQFNTQNSVSQSAQGQQQAAQQQNFDVDPTTGVTVTYPPRDPYDTRIGNGALPAGIYGSQNRAYVRDVTGNELTRQQMEGLLDDRNSAYMQSAIRHGEEFANRRGLLNSSLAAQSGQRAAIDAALPIAQSDAEAYRQAASENEQWLNQYEISRMGLEAANSSSRSALAAARLAEEGALQRQRENLAFQGEQAGLDRAFTNMRDYYLHQYDLQNDTHHTNNTIRLNGATSYMNMQSYAQRTGIDLRAQRQQFYTDVMHYALDNPDLFTPEVIGGIMNMSLSVFDDLNADIDSYFSDMGW